MVATAVSFAAWVIMVVVTKALVWDREVVNIIDMLADVTTIVVTAFEFGMPASLYEFSCCAVFDCWPMALLNCARALQAWMPSYHV